MICQYHSVVFSAWQEHGRYSALSPPQAFVPPFMRLPGVMNDSSSFCPELVTGSYEVPLIEGWGFALDAAWMSVKMLK